MNKLIIFTIIYILTISNIYTQSLKGIVLDKINLKPIEYANITYSKMNIGTSANSKGKFEIKLIKSDTLLISAIGYNSKKIKNLNHRDSLSIFLTRKTEELEEITLTSKKIKYSKESKLGLKRNFKIRTSIPIGYEYSCLIKNKINKRGKIETVILDINKNRKFDQIISYNIKFYKYDEVNKKPGVLISKDNFIVKPKNKTYKLDIDVSELNIKFPKNGICVGVEIIGKQNKGIIKDRLAPYLNFALTKLEILTWRRYRSKNWKVYTHNSGIKNKYINGSINLIIKHEK